MANSRVKGSSGLPGGLLMYTNRKRARGYAPLYALSALASSQVAPAFSASGTARTPAVAYPIPL